MNPIAPMQLRDYAVESLHIEINPDFKPESMSGYTGEIKFDFNFQKQQEAPVFMIQLRIMVNTSPEGSVQAPYTINIQLTSFVEFDKSYPESEWNKLLGPNGLAMTYSLARGIVGQITGNFPYGKLILPTINFIEVLKEKGNSVNPSASQSFARDRQ